MSTTEEKVDKNPVNIGWDTHKVSSLLPQLGNVNLCKQR
jgi:hypothetical protein